jgi:hypothetical protein
MYYNHKGAKMLKKALFFCLILIFGSVSYAGAACTPEEAQAKAQAFATSAATFAQKNPQKYQEIVMSMQKDLPALQQANNLDALCKFYDDQNAKMK